jgi:aminopeptidase N
VTFKVPNAMLRAQLKDKNDMVGRLLAIEQLSDKKDKDSVAALEEVLKNDSFYGVRIEAARALRAIHSDEALDALLASTNQSDARVRRAVVANIADFYQDPAYASVRRTVEKEHNPDIIASAIGGLSAYAKPEVRDVVLKYLNSDSFRNELADAAVKAIRSQDDPSYIAPLIDTLSKRGTNFTTRGFASGLAALAYISRNEEKKDQGRQLLVGYVNDKRERVQLAAISELGNLGDPQALAVVEKFAVGPKDSPQRQAAEKAVELLRAARKPIEDLKNLRQEVLDLQKTDRELRKDLDELKKKVEAKDTARTNAFRPRLSSPKGSQTK